MMLLSNAYIKYNENGYIVDFLKIYVSDIFNMMSSPYQHYFIEFVKTRQNMKNKRAENISGILVAMHSTTVEDLPGIIDRLYIYIYTL